MGTAVSVLALGALISTCAGNFFAVLLGDLQLQIDPKTLPAAKMVSFGQPKLLAC